MVVGAGGGDGWGCNDYPFYERCERRRVVSCVRKGEWKSMGCLPL